jgi:hypothetical protein
MDRSIMATCPLWLLPVQKCSTNTCQVNNQVLVPNNTTNVLKSVENITVGRYLPYITGCVVNFNINMK